MIDVCLSYFLSTFFLPSHSELYKKQGFVQVEKTDLGNGIHDYYTINHQQHAEVCFVHGVAVGGYKADPRQQVAALLTAILFGKGHQHPLSFDEGAKPNLSHAQMISQGGNPVDWNNKHLFHNWEHVLFHSVQCIGQPSNETAKYAFETTARYNGMSVGKPIWSLKLDVDDEVAVLVPEVLKVYQKVVPRPTASTDTYYKGIKRV